MSDQAVTEPAVALLLTLEDAHTADLQAIVIRHSSPGTELVVIDRTAGGLLPERLPEGVKLVRPSVPAGQDGLLMAIDVTTSPVISLRHPEGVYPPGHDQTLAAALDGEATMASGNISLCGQDGAVQYVVDPGQDGRRPPPLYWASLAFRRDIVIDDAAFFPNLLAAYVAAVDADTVARVSHPGPQLSLDLFAARRFAGNRDGHLLETHSGTYEDTKPWGSVIVAPGETLDQLWVTLGSLCRQVLPPGLFEVVLPAQAADAMSALKLRIPVQVAGEGEGRGGALQAGLDTAAGFLGIFVDAGLEAWPNLVEQHVRAHRDRPGQLLCAAGSVELPLSEQAKALGAALVAQEQAALDASGTAELSILPASGFRLSNGSLPLEGVRLAGGFTTEVEGRGVDVDLAWRLERDGYELLPVPAARCLRTALPTLSELADTIRGEARAEVAVLRRNPEALDAADALDVTTDDLEAALAPQLTTLSTVMDAAIGLSGLGTHAVEGMGGDWAEFAQDGVDRMGKLLTHLEKVWRMQGRLEGMQDAGVAAFVDLLKDQPLVLPGRRSALYLVRPAAGQELQWLGVASHFLAGFGPADDATLLLVADPENGGTTAEDLRTGLLELTRRMQPGPSGGWADVQVASASGSSTELLRLVAAATGWCPTGDALDEATQAAADQIGLPAVNSEHWIFRATDGVEPMPIATQSRFRAFVWPDWSSPSELETLFRTFAPSLANRDDVALLMRFDVNQDGDPDTGFGHLAAAFESTMPEGTSLEVVVVDNALDDDMLPRLGAAVQALIVLDSSAGPERTALYAAAGAPQVRSEQELLRAIMELPPLPMGPLYVPTMTLF